MPKFNFIRMSEDDEEMGSSVIEAIDIFEVLCEVVKIGKANPIYRQRIIEEYGLKFNNDKGSIYTEIMKSNKPLHNKACKNIGLTPKQTDALWWKMQNKSAAEIADILKIDKGAVTSRINLAKKNTDSANPNDLMRKITAEKKRIVKLQNKIS